jgi:dimethylglycine dehydrogenase
MARSRRGWTGSSPWTSGASSAAIRPSANRISLEVDAGDADAMGDEPIWHGGRVVGWVTSGGYGHRVGKSLAQGYVPRELAGDTAEGAFEIEIIGERRAATVLTEPPFDPAGARMRA